ncbi:TPA: glycosyltransferase [Bacillus cereus]|uniref:glycosyltransferase n=1 Tax=Bacillus thuringiensis TaxID=1428 RepID=UPI001298A614|nr:glycosyltransferase [Bacillus thuringiensis]HDR4737980.1 glycosyltransferase [Bacillus cereus]HDR4743260.1 glycosyltransferase [Bacillus cereus]HDR4749087.1 glycosyltransferase [Bacillus cereus]HDR4754558.1 glycosyltransferase [Bacillus cereus]
MPQKKVCMFVWNHFTNDARVLRECTALAEEDYEVDLICIHDWKQNDLPKWEMRKEGFTVTRVNNRLSLLQKGLGAAKRVKQLITKNIVTMFLFGVIAALCLWKFPMITCLILLFGALFSMGKLRTLIVRSYILIQMVKVGLKKEYDFYHSNDLNTLPQGWLCAKVFRKKKLIYDSHEVQTSRTGYNSKIYGIMEKFFLKYTDVMIMENHTRAKYAEDLYGFYPKVIHNYPFVTQPEDSNSINLHEVLEIPQEEPILLYQGGIQVGRGLEKLVQAVPMFKKGTLVFIGDGRIKPELQKMVLDLGLENKVKFIPKVPVNELLHYTKNAYLGFQVLNNVCFNHYSASSNKLFEYMMSGVPVVACSFPEIQRVVENEYVGVCIDSHNPASIAEGVNYILEHPEERERMRENSFIARNNYNWENEKELFIKIYKDLE